MDITTDPNGCALMYNQQSIHLLVLLLVQLVLVQYHAKKSFAPAKFFEVSDFSIKGVGYAFELGDKFEPCWISNSKRIRKNQ